MAIVFDTTSDHTDNPFFPYNEEEVTVSISDDDLAFPLDYIPPGVALPPDAPADLAVATQNDATPAERHHDESTVVSTHTDDELSPEDAIDSYGNEEPYDLDEEMDDNASDASSALTQVRPEEFPTYFMQHAGRLFHSHGTSPYPLPVDGIEQKRLDAQHIMLRMIMGRNFDGPVAEVLAPDDQAGSKKVVDLCTGTGLWAMEMAREFRHVQFRGLDLVPIATQYPHDNVRFQLADVTQRLPFANNSVDFVHARMTWLGIQNYPTLLCEVARILRPGGLFLACEWGAYPALHRDHPMHANPAAYIPHAARFFRGVTDGDSKGLPALALRLPHLIRANGAFGEPCERRRAIPVSTPYSPAAFAAGAPAPPGDGAFPDGPEFVASVFRRVSHGYAAALAAGGRTASEHAHAYAVELDTKVGVVSVWHTVWARKL